MKVTLIDRLTRALETALDDDRYRWDSPLGDLLQDDVRSAIKSCDEDVMNASLLRLAHYQKCVDHPDNGFIAIGASHIPGGRMCT